MERVVSFWQTKNQVEFDQLNRRAVILRSPLTTFLHLGLALLCMFVGVVMVHRPI